MIQIESIADDKLNVNDKLDFVLGRVGNVVGKRRKCWLPTFSPFPTIFSKALCFRVIKSQDCVVKIIWIHFKFIITCNLVKLQLYKVNIRHPFHLSMCTWNIITNTYHRTIPSTSSKGPTWLSGKVFDS